MSGYNYKIVFPVSFDYTDDYWQKFAASASDKPILTLRHMNRSTDRYEVETVESSGNRIFCVSQSILTINNDFSVGTVLSPNNDALGVYGCAMVALYGNLIRRNTLVMHSSLIDVNGEGILFTGPSGVGKTTQAELWEKHRKAKIINGDMVFIHKDVDGHFYAYGSPWHGSSEYCLNVRLPIKAIVAPIKADHCSIAEVDGIDMLKHIFPEIMLPDWFDGCKELGMDTLDELLKCTPVYRLECSKDIHAVETVEKELGMSIEKH